ncbi:hypothetical protein TKWG_14215 [Advenella kashmirensis WT001]|uniref:Hedgehog/Intein (Hint) domain-containing protein n=1 Tax=Advenella kashmirensis (strain DSM 17095 / LMG 22695 / WT001) TaxID=1036672 RepID=I3UD33_ADVKW|nr:Hint domain-containing protein [Advenella kashmirensis]AFK62921.1 hypothetical protein TKWG_14215 [Advenella kashmirensis WT001]
MSISIDLNADPEVVALNRDEHVPVEDGLPFDVLANSKAANSELTLTTYDNYPYFVNLTLNNEVSGASTTTLNLENDISVDGARFLSQDEASSQIYNINLKNESKLNIYDTELYAHDNLQINLSLEDGASFGYGVSNYSADISNLDNIPTITSMSANSFIQVFDSSYNNEFFIGKYDPVNRELQFVTDGQDNVVARFKVGADIDPAKLQIDGDRVSYACYLKGTRIATPEGETKVEDLKAGDKVLTASGGIAKVKWLGYRTLYKNRIPKKDAKRAFPILFKKGCIADNLPHRDLILSPGHHVSFGGNLVSAMNLVNGKSIVQLFDMSSFQYFHVELEQFDILLAEGIPAESYVDTGNRNMFQNAHEVAMNPDFGPAEGRPNIPGITVVRKGPILEAVRAKLLERANWMQAPEARERVG